jgi:hypothetical protein
MPFANPSITDLIATTIEFRSRDFADNVLNNIATLTYLKARNRVKTVSGGTSIMQEIAFAANANAMWYSGADMLSVDAQDVLSGANYPYAQCAVPVVVNGLEKIQNSGREKILDLVESRLDVAESSMLNLLSTAVHSDGTAFGGKQMLGTALFVPTNPATGTVGGISRVNFPFWRSVVSAPGAGVITSANVNLYMNDVWAQLVRNKNTPKLIVMDNGFWKLYTAFLQERQRFTGAETGALGFPTVKFQQADVVLDGGIGGSAPANTALFLNLDYLFFRPHSDRNMVALNPGRRYAFSQDIEAQILVFAGQMTMSGGKFHGRLHNN